MYYMYLEVKKWRTRLSHLAAGGDGEGGESTRRAQVTIVDVLHAIDFNTCVYRQCNADGVRPVSPSPLSALGRTQCTPAMLCATRPELLAPPCGAALAALRPRPNAVPTVRRRAPRPHRSPFGTRQSPRRVWPALRRSAGVGRVRLGFAWMFRRFCPPPGLERDPPSNSGAGVSATALASLVYAPKMFHSSM